jgi:DNA-binding SARP family transcriptional activator
VAWPPCHASWGRRVREAVAPGTETGILICLLGSFRVLKQGRSVHVRSGGKVEQLLGALALGPPRGTSRRDLLGLIWPDSEYSLAGQSLNTLIYSLHRTFADALDGESPIFVMDGRYRLNREAGVAVDVTVFQAAADLGDVRTRTGDWRGAAEAYEAATRTYAGDLTFGSDVRYLVERERLRARFLSVRANLAERAFASGDIGRALGHALELLNHDPCREDAHRLAMRCYVRLGMRAQALRQYRTCREVLALEFGAPPERSTDELYDLVRRDPERV